MQLTTLERIWALVDPVATEEGLEIVDIEMRREGRGSILRIYLDQQGGGGGVDLEALTRFSRQVSDVLDAHDPLPGSYTLETSSPGVNRRLRVPEHFRRYVGQRVRLRVHVPIDGQRTFLGVLRAVEPDGVVVATDDRETFVPFSAIAQANYEYDFAAERHSSKGAGARRQHATGTQSRH